MKRFFGILGLVALLLGAFGVAAQNSCNLGLADGDCDLLGEALDSLYDNGNLYFEYSLAVQVFYGASERRQLFVTGAGVLDRDEGGIIESFEMDALVTGRVYNNYNFINRDEYYSQNYLRFDENEFAFAEGDARGDLIEFGAEVLALGSLFPFLTETIEGEVWVEDIELEREDYRHYLAELDMPFSGGFFAPLQAVVFGEEIENLSGDGFYNASLLINLDDEEVAGASYSSYEFLDGENFGLEQDVRRQTNWLIQILPSNISLYYDFRVGDEQEDEDGVYMVAAAHGPLGLLGASLIEPLSDYYPPFARNEELGGINLDEIMGGSEADATATTTLTPTPANTATPRPTSTAFPTSTPLPAQDGFPCSATIAGEEGSLQSVVHREPTEEAVVVVAARAGQEVRVTFYVETDEGRWYHVEINRAVGYVHEDNIVLGEDCGE